MCLVWQKVCILSVHSSLWWVSQWYDNRVPKKCWRIKITSVVSTTTYQQNMRGVDRGDQMIGCYNIGRRSRKWWKRVFSYTIECAILNACILDSHINQPEHWQKGRKKRDYLKFRLDLANQLIGNHTSRKLSQHRSGNRDRLNTDIGHWPVQETNCDV